MAREEAARDLVAALQRVDRCHYKMLGNERLAADKAFDKASARFVEYHNLALQFDAETATNRTMTKPTPEAVALKAARALNVRNPPNDDWCNFAIEVGAKLFELGDKRDGLSFLPAHWLSVGILSAEARHQEELDEKFAAEPDAEADPEREARALRARERERLRELIRLVIVDGKPVK